MRRFLLRILRSSWTIRRRRRSREDSGPVCHHGSLLRRLAVVVVREGGVGRLVERVEVQERGVGVVIAVGLGEVERVRGVLEVVRVWEGVLLREGEGAWCADEGLSAVVELAQSHKVAIQPSTNQKCYLNDCGRRDERVARRHRNVI